MFHLCEAVGSASVSLPEEKEFQMKSEETNESVFLSGWWSGRSMRLLDHSLSLSLPALLSDCTRDQRLDQDQDQGSGVIVEAVGLRGQELERVVHDPKSCVRA